MKKRWLSLLLTLCMLVIFAPAAMANGETQEIYVSQIIGSDTTGAGTPVSPYQTLNHAIESVLPNESATIYVMSDMTVSESTRFWEAKDITITSYPKTETRTISRGTEVEPVIPTIDPARGGYNGALIEVGNGAKLTLTNIILDDQGYHEGEYFLQASTDNTSKVNFSSDYTNASGAPQKADPYTATYFNSELVQDAIIASYSNTSTITLGEGAVLKNYGGMSAVRVTNSATLVMKAGSKITNDDDLDKDITGDYIEYGDKSKKWHAKADTGAAGAVWVQSGQVIMEEGSEISNMVGRAIYADGPDSNVKVSGTISGIVADGDMWQGKAGTAFHIRNYAVAELNGTITDMQGSGSSAVYVVAHGEFTMNEYSSMNNFGTGVKGIQL